MLPWLKQPSAGIAATVSLPKEEHEEMEDDSLEIAAQDVIDSVNSGNPRLVAQSLKAFFEICDSEPHIEGPHIGE